MKPPEPWRYDGMLTSTPDGSRLCRVFAPRWWQLHHWLWWLLPVTAPRAKGWLTLIIGKDVLPVRYYVDDKTRLSLRRY